MGLRVFTCHVCSRGPVDSTPSASSRPTSQIYCHTATGQATAGEQGQRTIKGESPISSYNTYTHKIKTLLRQEMQQCKHSLTSQNIVVVILLTDRQTDERETHEKQKIC